MHSEWRHTGTGHRSLKGNKIEDRWGDGQLNPTAIKWETAFKPERDRGRERETGEEKARRERGRER